MHTPRQEAHTPTIQFFTQPISLHFAGHWPLQAIAATVTLSRQNRCDRVTQIRHVIVRRLKMLEVSIRLGSFVLNSNAAWAARPLTLESTLESRLSSASSDLQDWPFGHYRGGRSPAAAADCSRQLRQPRGTLFKASWLQL